jgi:RND family efflux transporter MFP subunit
VTPRRHRGITVVRWIVLGIVMLALLGCEKAQPSAPQLPRVSVGHPIARDVIDWDDYVGQFEAIQDVTVMPRVSGTITKILFQNGQDVKEGEPLFIIDPRPFEAAYQQALAATGRAQAVLINAQAELQRAQMLVQSDSISKTDYDLKVANLRTAEADLNAGKAAEATARLNLEFTTVRASVSGRVSDRRVSVGDVVSAGATQLTRIVTLDPIWFTFEGAESFYLKYVRQDVTGERRSSRYAPNPVEIQLADETGYPHKGRMVFVDNAIDTRSGTIRAHAEVPNADRFLTPGMFGRARLLGSGMYHAMLIPDESIVADQARKLAYVVGNDGKVAVRVVETGPLVSGLRVVKSGLVATDRVVLDGLAQLQPGAMVQPTLVTIKPRAADTSPESSPFTAPPPAQATEEQ